MLRRMSAGVSAACLLAALLAPAQDPVPRPIGGLQRVLWREERAEIWLLCAGGVRVFDPSLCEREPRPAEEMPPEPGVAAAADGSCDAPLWPGRRLRADARGRLRLLPAWWETPARLRWGPDWAAVELRAGRPQGALVWSRAGDAELHVERFEGEGWDGASQRAFLRGLVPGEQIRIALPDPLPVFPPRAELRWESFTVPAVPPDGPRPTSAWPAG